jgi:hypothetical protein
VLVHDAPDDEVVHGDHLTVLGAGVCALLLALDHRHGARRAEPAGGVGLRRPHAGAVERRELEELGALEDLDRRARDEPLPDHLHDGRGREVVARNDVDLLTVGTGRLECGATDAGERRERHQQCGRERGQAMARASHRLRASAPVGARAPTGVVAGITPSDLNPDCHVWTYAP